MFATAISVVAAAYNPFAGQGVYSAIYYAGSGFVSGYVANSGDVRSAAVRSTLATAIFGISEAFMSLKGAGYEALKVVSHGAVGGISSAALGGTFQSAFTTSAVS